MKLSGKRNPVLAELILVILFFSLSSAVLVQVFVKARIISETSRAETLGLVLAQDWIERWKSAPQNPYDIFSPENGWERVASKESGQLFQAFADDNMEMNPGETKAYGIEARLLREEQEAGILYRIRVKVVRNRDGQIVTDLETASYVPGEEGTV